MTYFGHLRSKYGSGKNTYSLEFFPPKTEAGLPGTKDVISHCAGFPVEFMTVTYGAGGSTRGSTDILLDYIHTDLKKPVISHLTCVGHSKSEIDSRLDELKVLGIRYILALRGDPPAGNSRFMPHPDGFSCARDLIRHIARRGDFAVAAAGYPEGHTEAQSLDADVSYLKEKVDAGAEVILTQLFFDSRFYLDFVERARRAGIQVPIIPGIMPIHDVAQLKRFTGLCGATIPAPIYDILERIKHDKEAVIDYGVELARAMCEDLLREGAPGIHFYTLNKTDQVYRVLSALNA